MCITLATFFNFSTILKPLSLIVRWCTNRGTMVPLLGEKFPWFDEFDGALSVLQDRTLFDIMA